MAVSGGRWRSPTSRAPGVDVLRSRLEGRQSIAVAYFERLSEERFRATEHTGGAWDLETQHIAPALGLMAHAVETDRDPRRSDGLVLTRLSYDILGTVPIAEVDIGVEVLRKGRTIELVEAVLGNAGRAAVRLRAWLMEPRDTAVVAGTSHPPIPGPDELEPWDPTTVWRGGFIASVEVRRHQQEPGRACYWVRTTQPLLADEQVSRLAALTGLLDVANGMTVRAEPTDVPLPERRPHRPLLRPAAGGVAGPRHHGLVRLRRRRPDHQRDPRRARPGRHQLAVPHRPPDRQGPARSRFVVVRPRRSHGAACPRRRPRGRGADAPARGRPSDPGGPSRRRLPGADGSGGAHDVGVDARRAASPDHAEPPGPVDPRGALAHDARIRVLCYASLRVETGGSGYASWRAREGGMTRHQALELLLTRRIPEDVASIEATLRAITSRLDVVGRRRAVRTGAPPDRRAAHRA